MWNQSSDRDGWNEFRLVDLNRSFNPGSHDLCSEGIKIEHYSQLPDLLVPVFGHKGFWLLVASLGIACMGAAMEITLQIAYLTARVSAGTGVRTSDHSTKRASVLFTRSYCCSRRSSSSPGRSVERHDCFDGPDGGDSSLSIVPFLFLMNDESMCAPIATVALECSRDFRHRTGVCVGGSLRSFADFRRELMDLVRDCLDKQLEDRESPAHGPSGRTDS
jgi:hypothetical protein